MQLTVPGSLASACLASMPAKALELLDRAKALTPEQDPAFPLVLLRWAVAAREAGRLPEAVDALERAIARFEAAGALPRRTPVRRWRALERSLEPRRAGHDRHRRAIGHLARTDSGPRTRRRSVESCQQPLCKWQVCGGGRDGRPCARVRCSARSGHAGRRFGDSRFLTLLRRRPRWPRRRGAWLRPAGGRGAGAERSDAAAQPRLRALVPGRPGGCGRDARRGAGLLGRARPGRVGADP